jgi:choline dehydrogenase-like flavoprotein
LSDRARALERARSTTWDAVIVGTGIGGATLGWALARAGWRVLFVEQGADTTAGAAGVLRGQYPELDPPRRGAALTERDAVQLQRAGRYADTLIDDSGPRPRRFVPFIGAGTGGSSGLYGMAMERFFPSDFEPLVHHPSAPGAALVERWPVSFEDMLPWYAEAERLYRVRRGIDPLGNSAAAHSKTPAPAWSAPVVRLATQFQQRGLHPYALPMACEFVHGCEGCQGVLCPKACKVDAVRACLEPARRDHGAHLLAECRVERLLSAGRRVTAVDATCVGQTLRLHGRIVVLAAGALRTPALLLRSATAERPQGLANESGLVGRLLMRHLIDLYMINPDQADDEGLDNRRKEIAFSDFYEVAEGKLGTVQSFGRLPPSAMVVGALQEDVRQGSMGALHHAVGLAKPLLERALRPMVERSLGLVSQVEDLPYADNCIWPDSSSGPGALRMRYTVAAEGQRRVEAMRRRMRGALSGRRYRLLAQADNNQRIAHACGTCRFGDDPRSSVLDAFNRAHELDNVYVVDASFFPSSAGTNPSLTIAANALRVAQHLGASAPTGAAR